MKKRLRSYGASRVKRRRQAINNSPLWGEARGLLLVLLTVFGSVACLAVVSFRNTAQAQKRRVRKPSVQRPAVPAIDYSRFSHATKKHQGACNPCHKVPTANWKKVREFPDVADFPGHDACVSCHRQQFFKGARPVICSDCHSKVSPRDDARFAFRNPATAREFFVEFPHDKHQDVIAKLSESPGLMTAAQAVSLGAWAHARRVSAKQSQPNSLRYYNCEICHGPRTTVPAAPPSGWADSFVPDAAAFKAVPTSHAACFNCHWKSEQPTGENCGGRHKR